MFHDNSRCDSAALPCPPQSTKSNNFQMFSPPWPGKNDPLIHVFPGSGDLGLVVWDSVGMPLSNKPGFIGGCNRNPNHRDPNQQLTISWRLVSAKQNGVVFLKSQIVRWECEGKKNNIFFNGWRGTCSYHKVETMECCQKTLHTCLKMFL